MKFTIIFFFFVLVLFYLPSVVATDYFVSPDGSDYNNGLSVLTPFDTIKHGFSVVDAGDTLFLLDGIFNEKLKLSKSGSLGNPIIIAGYGDNAIMNHIDNHGLAMEINDIDHITIRNIEITHYDTGIYATRSNYITIDNCHIHFLKTNAITIYDGHDCQITNCDIHDGSWNLVQIMAKYNDVYNLLIDGNKIHGNPGKTDFGQAHAGLDIFNANYENPADGLVHDMTITNNKIYDCDNSGIFTHGDDDFYMENMVFECNEIYDTNSVETGHFKDSLIKNNYVHDQKVWGFFTYDGSGKLSMKNTEIIGNVVSDCPYLKSNRALGDNTWIGGSIPDFIHWTGTLTIIDNNRKTYDIRTQNDVYIRYSDKRHFTVDGKSATPKSGYSEYFIESNGKDVLYEVHNPSGTNEVVIPSCISNPSPAPAPTSLPPGPKPTDAGDETPYEEDTPYPGPTAYPIFEPVDDEIYNEFGYKYYSALPEWDSTTILGYNIVRHYYQLDSSMTSKEHAQQMYNPLYFGLPNETNLCMGGGPLQWTYLRIIGPKYAVLYNHTIYSNSSDVVYEVGYLPRPKRTLDGITIDSVSVSELYHKTNAVGDDMLTVNITCNWHKTKRSAKGTRKQFYVTELYQETRNTIVQWDSVEEYNETVECVITNHSGFYNIINMSGLPDNAPHYNISVKMGNVTRYLLKSSYVFFKNRSVQYQLYDMYDYDFYDLYGVSPHGNGQFMLPGGYIDNISIVVSSPFESYELETNITRTDKIYDTFDGDIYAAIMCFLIVYVLYRMCFKW